MYFSILVLVIQQGLFFSLRIVPQDAFFAQVLTLTRVPSLVLNALKQHLR